MKRLELKVGTWWLKVCFHEKKVCVKKRRIGGGGKGRKEREKRKGKERRDNATQTGLSSQG